MAIGTGHVRRCLALAHAFFEAGAEVRFVTRDLGVDAATMVSKAGFDVVELAAPCGAPITSAVPHAAWAGVGGRADTEATIEVLREWEPAWVIIDHYAFDSQWHEAVRRALSCRILVIDDLADRSIAADLLVDQNLSPDHTRKYAGRLERDASLLVGPRFALLGPSFANAPRYRSREEVRSIGVFMGGVDQSNMSLTALAAIAAARFEGEVELVSTSSNPNLASLCEAAAARPGTIVSVDLPDLAGFFARHDLQIGAGGGATWERCCIGAPTVLLVVAENQLAVVPELASKGVVASTEPIGAVDVSNIAATLRQTIGEPERRRILAEHSQGLVDGLGARRVALRTLAETLTVRSACRDDGQMMHRWRNDPVTRSVSRNTAEIGWDDHMAWLNRTLADPVRSLMIGAVGGLPVGVIRFDRGSGRTAEVSLYLDPALHGLGLGRAMLLAGEADAACGLDISAEVMEGNIGSARLFESAGYRRIDTTHWIKPANSPAQAEMGRG